MSLPAVSDSISAWMIDVPGGTLTFRYVTNPICNSQDLVPPNR